MVVDYDVIIAGAGPAGAECARYLAEHSKYKVLLLDRTQEIGEPKKSTAGTFQETIDVFKLPRKVIQSKISNVIFEGPSEEAVFPAKGYVLDFGKLKKFLVESAVHKGVDLKINSTVTRPVFERKKIVGLEHRDREGVHVVRGRIIIDATGPEAALATRAGLRKLNPVYHAGGVEFEMERLNLKHQNAMVFRLDTRYAPGGYAWIFSTGKNHGKVGVCWAHEWSKKLGAKYSQLVYLKKFIKDDKRLCKAVSMEVHAGDAYIDPDIRTRVLDNFMMIGDASCTVHPLLGEGVKTAMYSGMFAAQVAIEALRKKDTSAKQLSKLDVLWKDRQRNHKISLFISKAVGYLSNERLDIFVRNLNRLDRAAQKRFFDYHLNLKDWWKLLPL